jgi:hypothetical protein
MSVADPKIIDPVPRIQLRGQPARLLTAASPSLEWSRRILEFRKNLRIRSTGAVNVSAICFRSESLVKLAKALVELRFFGCYLCSKSRGDRFMKDPQLVSGHRFKVTSFHSGLVLKISRGADPSIILGSISSS